MMYAPREVNQKLQNPHVEERLRELQALYRREMVRIELVARARSYPLSTASGHLLLEKVSYSFRKRLPNGKTELIGEVDITIPALDLVTGRSSGKLGIEVSYGSGSNGVFSIF